MRRALGLTAVAWAASGLGCDAAGGREGGGRRESVVLVVLDATRADHVGAYGYARETTPHIDAFAREAVRYETVVSDAAFTFLSIGSLMAGAPPFETGLSGRSGGRVPDSLELLAERAGRAGYATAAYSENPYVTRYFGLAQGFDRFDEAFPVEAHAAGRGLPPGLDSADRILALLDGVCADPSRPFFLYVHLLRPHNPYAPGGIYAGRFGSRAEERLSGTTERLLALDARGPPFSEAEIAPLVALYDENLAHADALFGRVLDALAVRGRADDTIVVLTADHGEAFGEHGRLLHSTQVFEPMVRVPLLVRVPGAAPRNERRPIQLSDLGRALADFFGSTGDSGAWAGIADLGRDRPREDARDTEPLYAWTNARSHLVAARTAHRKLVVDATTLQPVAYHDLEADPGERVVLPLDAEGERLLARVRARIAQWTGARAGGEVAAPLDARARAQLEALGYAVEEERDRAP